MSHPLPPQEAMAAQRQQERLGGLLEEVMGKGMGEAIQAEARDSREHSKSTGGSWSRRMAMLRDLDFALVQDQKASK